ncbi:MAG: hypothetical protein VYE22_09905 [Myxococcota bacterium]|nr:hypothetical protein [Myxococcota bacterium]
MGVDASAVARVLGIETSFEDRRAGGVLFLPQRLVVIAQGASDAVYSSAKRQVTGAQEGGSVYGYGSPIHLSLRELFPLNNDGVGTIPVTVIPLSDHASGVAAAGDITPTGSQTRQAAYRVKVNNILSEAFVIPVGASVTAICAAIGQAVAAVLEMPVAVSYAYGSITATPDGGNTGDGTVTGLSASGTPVPGDYTLECTATAADGGTFRLLGPDGAEVASGLVLAGGTLAVDEGGLAFTINDGATDFAEGDSFTIAVPATAVNLMAKWKGASGNALYVELEGEDYGVTFTVTQPTGGLVNPSVQPALDLIGDVWETMGLNALDIADTTALDALQAFGDGRWGALVRKPIVFFTGVTEATVAAATAVSATRRDDRVNAQLVSPGSRDLPFVVAARQLARIAAVANNNPPTDYGSQRATGLTPGADSVQWDYVQRDQAVKAGSSTVVVKSGVVNIGDVVTFYRPEGDPLPAYRHVVDIVKLQNVIFNVDLIFNREEWDGAPLIPDDQPTVNPNARKPLSAKAAVGDKLDSLALNAIISDAKTAKKNTVAVIDPGNPRRLNVTVPIQLSGNTNIIDVALKFGFFFGSAAGA